MIADAVLLSLIFPAVHGIQDVAPVPLCVPAGQFVQDVAPVKVVGMMFALFPPGQSSHFDAPAALYFPASHGIQDVAPVSALVRVPAGHLTQDVTSSNFFATAFQRFTFTLFVPTGHVAHLPTCNDCFCQ